MKSAPTLAGRYLERRFTVLFAILLFAIAGHGLVGIVLPVENPMDWLIGVGLLAVVFSAQSGRLRWILGGVVSVCVAARLMQGLVDHPAPPLVGQFLVAVACVMAAGVAIQRAFAPGAVDGERICAALDVYLLIGIAAGSGYWLMETTLPGSFSSASGGEFTPARATYFSFVTQATLGFGDITPVRERAQGLVIVQGVGGQLYLAVLIARLVSLYSAAEKQ